LESFLLFADDLAIYVAKKTIEESIKGCQTALGCLMDWCNVNGLEISFSKTKFIIFHKAHDHSIPAFNSIDVRGNKIERVNCFKYLGVHLDSNLDFNFHFQQILKKLNQVKGCLKHFRKFVTFPVYVTLFKTYFLSVIDYCSPVWRNICQSKVESINYLLHSKIRNFPGYERASEEKIFEETDLLSIRERLDLNSLMFTWKLLRFGTNILHVQGLFQIFDQNRSSISSTTIVVQPHNSSSFERSFRFSAVFLWNKLDRTVRKIDIPFAKFKEKLLVHFIKKREELFVVN